MNLLEAKLILDAIVLDSGNRASGLVFGVKIFSPGGLRRVPVSKIKRIVRDIDLGSETVYAELEEEVSKISASDREAIMTSVRRGGSWHAFQAHKRSAEIIESLEKRLAEAIKTLEAAGLPVPSKN